MSIPYSESRRKRWGDSVRAELERYDIFRVMDLTVWNSASFLTENSPLFMSTEVLRSFDPTGPIRTRGQREHSPINNLGVSFTPEARECVCNAFLLFARFSATLGGWFLANENPTIADVKNVFSRFCDDGWGTYRMHRQLGDDWTYKGMALGWHVASVSIKIQAEELHSKVRQRVDVPDFANCVLSWSSFLVQETAIWFLSMLGENVSISACEELSFLLHDCISKLSRCLTAHLRVPTAPRLPASLVDVHQLHEHVLIRLTLIHVDKTPGKEIVQRNGSAIPASDRGRFLPSCHPEFDSRPEKRRRRSPSPRAQEYPRQERHRSPFSHSRDFRPTRQDHFQSARQGNPFSGADADHRVEPRDGFHRAPSHYETRIDAGNLMSADISQMRVQLLGLDPEDERLDLDNPNSDNEECETLHAAQRREHDAPRASPAERSQILNQALDVDYEIFFAHITSWLVEPRRSISPQSSIVHPNNTLWLEHFISLNGSQVLSDVSKAKTLFQYAAHWRVLILVEVHAALRVALGTSYPAMMRSPEEYMEELNSSRRDFISLWIKSSDPARLNTNLICVSNDTRLNTSLFNDISGMTVCVAFFRRGRTTENSIRSGFHFVLVRSVHVSPEDIHPDGGISRISFRLIGNRVRLQDCDPQRGDHIHIHPVMSFAVYHRMIRAVHNLCKAPMPIRQQLCGPLLPQHPQSHPAVSTAVRVHTPVINPDHNKLRENVDSGCLQYLDSLPSTHPTTSSQKAALETVLTEIGALHSSSGSISLIHGPPGTGKSTVIRYLVGALLSHSSAGHVGSESQYSVRDGVKFLQSSPHVKGRVRLLVTAPSNNAVDDVTRELLKGLPHPEGIFFPENVRVGRHRYPYKDLSPHSYDKRISMYKDQLRAEGQEDDENLLAASKRLLEKNTIVYLTTNCSAGSGQFRDIKSRCNFLIMDEAGNCLEPEGVIPLAAITRDTEFSHAVLVGDHKQLGAVSKSMYDLVRFTKEKHFSVPFQVNRQFDSCFQRLMDRLRTAATMLTMQFRSHPHIAAIQTVPFYGNLVSHTEVNEAHIASFNQRGLDSSPHAFSPFTFVDTSQCMSRQETRGDRNGAFTNSFEAELVNQVLWRLWDCCKEDRVAELTGNIAVLAPYRSQVEFLQTYLHQIGKCLSNPLRKLALSVKIGTIDELQGGERDVVIVSLTRSNRSSGIGFVRDSRRLNVATSRSRKLLVLIGDSSTLTKSPDWTKMWQFALKGSPGSEVIFVAPQAADEDRAGAREVTSLKQRFPSLCFTDSIQIQTE